MALSPWFDRLFDDAALFPPGNAPMAEGVAAHRRHQRAWFAQQIGSFICTDARIGELAAAVAAAPERLQVSVIVTRGAQGVAAAAAEVRSHPHLVLSAMEIPVAVDDPQGSADEIARTVTDIVPEIPAYVEVPRGALSESVLDVLSAAGHRAKLRTGGEEPAVFPDEREVAVFVLRCLERRIAFKCTAGLHHAVRHTAADTGFEHHGFLNVLLAVHAGLEGQKVPALTQVLAERDAQRLVARLQSLPAQDAGSVRTWFTSFGTCSVTEPIDDLIALGLVQPGHS